jgi:hypothetical protein
LPDSLGQSVIVLSFLLHIDAEDVTEDVTTTPGSCLPTWSPPKAVDEHDMFGAFERVILIFIGTASFASR